MIEDDFEALRLDPRKYRLYAGHITGPMLRYLPQETQFVTINRDPVERTLSEYHWILYHYPRLLAQRLELGEDPGQIADLLEFLQRVDIQTALAADTPDTRMHFRDRVLRQIGAGQGLYADVELDNDSPLLASLRERRWQKAVELLSTFSVVGDYTDIEGAALLLAATRDWPAPPPLPRVHDIGAPTMHLAADAAIRERIRAVNVGDVWLYDLTRARAASLRKVLRERCGAANPSAVDRQHVARYFGTAAPVIAFDIEPDAPRNGVGWGLAERDGYGNPFRAMRPARVVSTLARLDPSIGDYRVFCQVFHSSSFDILESLTLRVADVPLDRVAAGWQPWSGQRAYIIEWQLPQQLVVRVDARIELVFEANLRTSDDALWLGKMGCVPPPCEPPTG